MDSIRLRANAKINLGLEVLKKRDDGFHDVKTVLQTISLHDKLTLKLQGDGIKIRSNSPWVPRNEKNIAYRAAAALLKRCKSKCGVKITIKKNIPIGAGLGGGSSDGAAVLSGLNELLQLNLSVRVLQELASELGSDVPFFLQGGTALASGRGDQLQFFRKSPSFWGLVVYPNFSVSTAWAYDNIKTPTKSNSNMKKLIDATQKGDLREIAAHVQNGFECVIFQKYPMLKAMKKSLVSKGAEGAVLCGSGSSLFGMFRDKETAEKALFHFSDSGYSAWIVRSCDRD